MKRELNTDYDKHPTIQHKYNLFFIKSYIKNKNVLDIGCWTGQLEKLIKTYSKSVFAIDPYEPAILYAKKTIKDVHFEVANALTFKYPAKHFDIVLLMDVIEHIPNKTESELLLKIRATLKKNGLLILSTPNDHIFSILADPAYFLLKHRHYSKKDLINLLTNANFKIVKIHTTGGSWRIITTLIDFFMKHIFHNKIVYPKWIYKKIWYECVWGGFDENYIIAQKK